MGLTNVPGPRRPRHVEKQHCQLRLARPVVALFQRELEGGLAHVFLKPHEVRVTLKDGRSVKSFLRLRMIIAVLVSRQGQQPPLHREPSA